MHYDEFYTYILLFPIKVSKVYRSSSVSKLYKHTVISDLRY